MSFLQPGPTCPLRHQASRRAASEDPSEFTLEARQILRQSLCGVEQASLCWPSVGWLLAEFLGSEWSPSAPWVREAVVHLIYVVSGFSAPDRSNSFPFWMHRIYLCFWFGFVCVCVCVCRVHHELGSTKTREINQGVFYPTHICRGSQGRSREMAGHATKRRGWLRPGSGSRLRAKVTLRGLAVKLGEAYQRQVL